MSSVAWSTAVVLLLLPLWVCICLCLNWCDRQTPTKSDPEDLQQSLHDCILMSQLPSCHLDSSIALLDLRNLLQYLEDKRPQNIR